MKENRKETRVELSLTARWQGSANRDVRISDLSKGGCYIDTIADVTVGELLSLTILLTDGKWLELEGVVAHHTPRLGFGVRFVNLNQKQRAQICLLLGLPAVDAPESHQTSNGLQASMPLDLDLTTRVIM